MNKLKSLKANAKKFGESVVASTMLTTGILGITPNDIITNPTARTKPSQVSVMSKNESTKTTKASNQNRIQDMLWLDEDHLIINGEILTNEEAYAKYPQYQNMLERFAAAGLHEQERELHPSDELPKDGWQTLPPEKMAEVEKRVQNFDIDDYLPNQDKTNEPTMGR